MPSLELAPFPLVTTMSVKGKVPDDKRRQCHILTRGKVESRASRKVYALGARTPSIIEGRIGCIFPCFFDALLSLSLSDAL